MDEKKPPADILEEIMSRSEKPLPSPVSYPPKFDPPPPEDTPPPAPAVEKPPLAERLLPWLCALLGGAVLAALVLGFQLFSVNARLDTLTASVGEIQTVDELRKENDRLKTSVQDMVSDQQELLERDDVLEQNIQKVVERYSDLSYRGVYQNALALLERFNRAGDWLMSGTLVERMNSLLNPPDQIEGANLDVITHQNALPSQRSRYLELREELFDKGGCMVIESWQSTGEDGSVYTEQPYIREGIYKDADRTAAGRLLTTLLYYPTDPNVSAPFLAEYFQPDSRNLARLSAGAFQPSTVELFEQMRSDLLAEGWLEENPDGTLSAVNHGDILYGTQPE